MSADPPFLKQAPGKIFKDFSHFVTRVTRFVTLYIVESRFDRWSGAV
jgi:hypothetical protein